MWQSPRRAARSAAVAVSSGVSSVASQPTQVHRGLAGERLDDAARGDRADPRELLERAGRRTFAQLVDGQLVDDGSGVAERPHAVRGFACPLEQERDLPQVGGRIARVHAADVTGRCVGGWRT